MYHNICQILILQSHAIILDFAEDLKVNFLLDHHKYYSSTHKTFPSDSKYKIKWNFNSAWQYMIIIITTQLLQFTTFYISIPSFRVLFYFKDIMISSFQVIIFMLYIYTDKYHSTLGEAFTVNRHKKKCSINYQCQYSDMISDLCGMKTGT